MGTEIEAVIRAGPAEMSLSQFQAGPATARPTERNERRQAQPRADETREAEAQPAEEPAPAKTSVAQGNVGLVFEVSRDGRELVIKIVDREHDRVLRTIPPEEVQRIRTAMRDLVGLLVDRQG
jgi:uncharacterized FlaG/YvyC family protein